MIFSSVLNNVFGELVFWLHKIYLLHKHEIVSAPGPVVIIGALQLVLGLLGPVGAEDGKEDG